jgi:hypothetical protein
MTVRSGMRLCVGLRLCACMSFMHVMRCYVCRNAAAERYSLLMRALRFSHPSDSQLDLRFDVDGTGVSKLPGSGRGSASRSGSQLLQVSVDECECAPQRACTLQHAPACSCEVVHIQRW